MNKTLFGNIPVGGFFMHPDGVSVMRKVEATSATVPRVRANGRVSLYSECANGFRVDGAFAHWSDDEVVEIASACQYEVDGPHLKSNWRE
jgi:hypothetical protein